MERPLITFYDGNINIFLICYLLPFTRYSQSKCARLWPWPLEWAKVKFKNNDRKPHMTLVSVAIYEIFAIKMFLTLIWPLESAKVKCKYANCNATYDFLFDVSSNTCSIGCHLWYSQIKSNTNSFTLIMKVKVKEEKNGTCTFQLEMFDSLTVIYFQNISYPAANAYAIGNTHTHSKKQRYWLKVQDGQNVFETPYQLLSWPLEWVHMHIHIWWRW